MADNVLFDFRGKCPIFDHRFGRRGGVVFPFVMGGDVNGVGINLDGSDVSTILGKVSFPFKVAFISADAYPISDDQGLKAGAASTEPIISIVYGTIGLASGAAGTELCAITCSGSGALSDKWSPGTSSTETDIETTQEIAVYLYQAASSGTSNLQDGAAKVVLWLAQVQGP